MAIKHSARASPIMSLLGRGPQGGGARVSMRSRARAPARCGTRTDPSLAVGTGSSFCGWPSVRSGYFVGLCSVWCLCSLTFDFGRGHQSAVSLEPRSVCCGHRRLSPFCPGVRSASCGGSHELCPSGSFGAPSALLMFRGAKAGRPPHGDLASAYVGLSSQRTICHGC